MKIGIANDHRGVNLKKKIMNYLHEKDISCVDYGTNSDESCDYVDYALKLGNAINNKEVDLGILICGTGIGMSIAANKINGIRCARVVNSDEAKLSREHNMANIMAIGENIENVFSVVDTFINTKESKAEELSVIVEEREAKAEELQQILDERQEKADGITAQVAKQIDVLIESVHEKMAEIEQSMNAGMDSLGRQVSSDMDNLGSSVSGQIGNLGQSLGTEISGISQNIGQSLDFGDTLEQTRRITEEGTAAVTSAVNEANAHMLQSLKELNDQLVSIKAELADKVHTENVKCFRNIQDLFKVMGDKVDTVSELEKQVGTTKTFAVISTVLAIINTFGFVVIALYILGFFGSIF